MINNVNNITGDSRPQIAEILAEREAGDRGRAQDDRRRGPPAQDGKDGKPGELRSTIERVNRASASLESTLAHADDVAARIDKGEGTIGRLTKDETLINEVESVVEDVGDFVGGISRVQTVVGLRTDYNFLANTIKSYVELRLQPSEDKYYLIELVNDPRGKTSFEQIDVDTTNPNLPPHYREITHHDDQRLPLLVPVRQAHRARSPAASASRSRRAASASICTCSTIASSSGRTSSASARSSRPAGASRSAYEFIRKLWLLGGVDDILNSDRRDYFVGLQLRFTDQDLKTILPFAPKGP